MARCPADDMHMKATGCKHNDWQSQECQFWRAVWFIALIEQELCL